MPNVNAVLNDQIRRLARREIKANTKTVKKATSQYRRDIAALKRQVGVLTRDLHVLQKQGGKFLADLPLPAQTEGLRFRADGLKTHRAKLGLSAEDYGQLVGVSALSIYHWESRKAKPRKGQLPKLAAVRSLGKREALKRLGIAETAPEQSSAPRGTRTRGKFKHTAEESVLSLLKARRALTTAQINQAWTNEGRLGNADNTLSLMVKTKKLKRVKINGERGSQYTAA